MRALTLHGCWAYAVASLGKDIENRSWEIPQKHLGTTIGIHAGSNSGREDADWLRGELGSRAPLQWPKSAIVALATLAGCVTDDGQHIGKLTREQAARARASGWYSGPYGWVLTDVRALAEPIACKGALGLWTIPDDVCARVMRALGNEVRP